MKGLHRLEWSVIGTIAGVILLFSFSIAVILIAPRHIDPSWQQASSVYQVQMYEVSDPNVYLSTSNPGGYGLQYVYHLKSGDTLCAYQESELVRILAAPDLEQYVTLFGDGELKLTTRLLLLRKPILSNQVASFQKKLQEEWKQSDVAPRFQIYELYDPLQAEAFVTTQTDGIIEHWVDKKFRVLDKHPPYSTEHGTLYILNPVEYRFSETQYLGTPYWLYDENGETVSSVEQLQSGKLKFISRQKLIEMGEDIYRVEGCWYCHTDQTRTLVQDTVLNGSASHPAPPSSASEYVFQRVTFPGTRRIGPDLSRVGIKRQERDWHMSHFWSPKTASRGTIMPAFKHFFDDDPSGTARNPYGIPNYQFEAIFQYLMTKGTRILPPTQAWWIGKDPIQTLDIIEGNMP